MLADTEKVRIIGHVVDLSTSAPAAKEIRIFGLGEELRRRQRTLRAEVDAHMFRAQLVASLWTIGTQLLSSAAYLGAIYLVVHEAATGRRTVGDVVLAIVLAAQVNGQLSNGLDIIFTLQRALLATERMRWLRALVHDLEPDGSRPAPVPERLERGIVCDQVSFRYPGTEQDVLRDVSFELAPGSTLAIVGDNGAGKTTLVKLLCRFYEPTAGRILVDGTELSRFEPGAWRERMSAAFQDYHRFELVTRESVGIGDLPQIEDADGVRAALARAHATDVVDGLAEGIETMLGKSYADGAELSGGQWQKLALGRAMMRETPLLLVLDEPTAALDAHAEHALFERYAASARAVGTATGAITIFVSHRFSTVRMADHIVVLRDGAVVEQGSHDELIRLGNLYAELFELQAAAYR
jgi:ATP-binding cassette subfamily B protein